MNEQGVDAIISLMLLLALFVGLVIWWMMQHGSLRSRIAERTRAVADDRRGSKIISTEADAAPDGFYARLQRRLARLGEKVPFFDNSYRLQLQKELVRGGYRSGYAVSILLAVKFIVGLCAAVVTVSMGSHLPLLGHSPLTRGIAMMGAFIVGMIVPEYQVKWRARQRRNQMGNALPDALDLLVICTNAGNSFVVSIRRVADEMASICPPLSNEFSITADEIRLSGDVTRSLQDLAERIDLPAIRALIATLTQSMRYGTPITQALRVLSRTERLAHIISLEEKAAKLAPKMVLPMMLFILPPVVAISAGPAVIRLMEFFHK